jgi:tRNA G18 (ribose-2'-O)-methylase SpoU
MNRGFYGIGVFHTKKEQNIGTLLRSANCFGAAFVFTIGRRYKTQGSDTLKTERHVPLYHYADIADLKAHLPMAAPLIGIELDPRSVPLTSFQHPSSAVYLLGAEDHGLTPDALAACHQIVHVEGASRCLNVSVAGSIVMHDRVSR